VKYEPQSIANTHIRAYRNFLPRLSPSKFGGQMREKSIEQKLVKAVKAAGGI
jgi:hypothetical protein